MSSRTTLLGLLEHAVYLERFYFDHVITGRPPPELSVATTPDRSFMLQASETIASLTQAHAQACDDSRAAVTELQLDRVMTGRGADRSQRSTCRCCANWPSTRATSTSCASRS